MTVSRVESLFLQDIEVTGRRRVLASSPAFNLRVRAASSIAETMYGYVYFSEEALGWRGAWSRREERRSFSATQTATLARAWTPSLLKMFAACRSTVAIEMLSSSAIIRFDRPRPIRAATSSSRGLSGGPGSKSTRGATLARDSGISVEVSRLSCKWRFVPLVQGAEPGNPRAPYRACRTG